MESIPRCERYSVGIEGSATNVLKNGKNFSSLRTFSRRDQLKVSHLDYDLRRTAFFLDALAALAVSAFSILASSASGPL